MMESLVFIMAAGTFVIISLLLVIILLPDEKKKKFRRRKDPASTISPAKQKNWEEIALRREHALENSKNEIRRLEEEGRDKDRQLAEEKEKNIQLQEKLKLEQSWREKEDAALEKNIQKAQQFREDLMKSEQNFEKEHSQNIKLRREIEETLNELNEVNKDRRELSLKVLNLETIAGQLKKELNDLKKAYLELKKKDQEFEWVTKADHDKILEQLKEKEKELQRLSRRQLEA